MAVDEAVVRARSQKGRARSQKGRANDTRRPFPRHDFYSSEDCKAFVAALNSSNEMQLAATEEDEARAEKAAARLLAKEERRQEEEQVNTAAGLLLQCVRLFVQLHRV